MPSVKFEIENYQVTLGLDLPSIQTGKDEQVCGIIGCYGKDYQLMLNFVKEGSALPAPFYDESKKTGVIFLPYSHLNSYVDILRNEKPVYGYCSSDKPEWNSVSTQHEAVGEGE